MSVIQQLRARCSLIIAGKKNQPRQPGPAAIEIRHFCESQTIDHGTLALAAGLMDERMAAILDGDLPNEIEAKRLADAMNNPRFCGIVAAERYGA